MATVFKLIRKLTYTKIGAKRRRFEAPAAARPTCAQWAQALSQKGGQGGLSLRTVARDAHCLEADEF